MKTSATSLPGVLILEPRVFEDERGFFFESFNQRVFDALTGTSYQFVQDNHSRSGKGVLRGMHYQTWQPQGKLVRVVRGSVFDVVVDIRQGSPNFGQWFGLELSEHNQRMLWMPPGLAHGFLVLSVTAEVLYKATDYYAPRYEATLMWNDPQVAIAWPLAQYGISQPLLSDKDRSGVCLLDCIRPCWPSASS